MDNRHFGGPRPLPGCRPSFGDLEFSAAEINELLKRLVKMQDVEGLVSGVNIVNIENHELLQPGNLTLEDLGAARLANMNDVFVPWQGSAYDTRNYLPALLRRKGISISYVTDKGLAVKERAVSDVGIDNANWGIDSNWMRVDELSLNGELHVSPNGTWVINGVDSGIQALGPKGDNGLTPRLKTIDNKLHYSYDDKEWLDAGGEHIAAWFRWSGNKIQISRDNKTWNDFSGEFADNLFIKGYVATFDKLPADAVQGDIWGVGPRYAAEDIEQTQPIYRYWVRNAGGWVDNGEFTSIAAGIVQETGDGEGVVMSQKAVTEKFTELESKWGYDLTWHDVFATKVEARRYAVMTLNLPITKGVVIKYNLTSGDTITEICVTDDVTSYDDGWSLVDKSLLSWEKSDKTLKYEDIISIHNNLFKVFDLDSLKSNGVVFATKADARRYAVVTLKLQLNPGNVLSYTLDDKTRIIEILNNVSASSSDATWVNMVDFCGFNPYARIYNLNKIFATKVEARRYAVMTLSLSLKVGDVLLYFIDNAFIADVLISLNDGEVSSFDEHWIDAFEQGECPISFFTDAFLQSCSKGKCLTKIACVGDSLLANAIGGAIPSDLDEGRGKRPMRMLTNGIPRRIYDFLSWNKPIWRRLEHWDNNGFSLFSESGLFEGTSEDYWKADVQGAYIELSIPDGYENFALICRTKSGYGSLKVTLNGGGVGKFANPYYTDKVASNNVVNSSVVPQFINIGEDIIDLNQGITPNGNPYHIVEFHNLPSGTNVIRFTTTSNARCDVWGGFYWHGNTMVVMNLAHGGHTTSNLLSEHLEDELFSERYDAVMFEVTEMNNLRMSISETLSDLGIIINRFKMLNLDYCITSCNPLGLSIEHDTNFYSEYANPTMLQLNDKVRAFCYNKKVPFVDIFTYFHRNIISRGGSLESGEGGLWYTWDGQHGNEQGVKMWFDCLLDILSNKPLVT